jgi:hypothetical protein
VKQQQLQLPLQLQDSDKQQARHRKFTNIAVSVKYMCVYARIQTEHCEVTESSHTDKQIGSHC